MFLDLHTHSIASDDSRATVEQFVQWAGVLRKKGRQLDGFVLTEHRQFNHEVDYTNLSGESGLLILKGAELDTDTGHFLVYGVTEELTNCINFGDVNMNAQKLVEASTGLGAIAVPAHPGRAGIGFSEFIAAGKTGFDSVRVVEGLNGSNRPGEEERSDKLVAEKGYHTTGGSDAHIVSAIGTCMTDFKDIITNESDLVAALRRGNFSPVKLEDTSK
jgi:predicted metal-dependent phosphoesterase TrpH